MMGHAIAITVILFILLAAVGLAIVGGLYVMSDGEGAVPEATSSSTLSSTVTTSTVPTTTTTTSTVFTPTTTTTSTTLLLGRIKMTIAPEMPYRLDDVIVTVSYDGEGSDKAALYLNGKLKDTLIDGTYRLISLESGHYEVVIERKGFWNASTSFDVDDDTYATSREVRQKLSRGQELVAMREGKAVIRFYDTSSCSVCKVVVSKLNKLVDDNRECIAYEKLSYYKYANKLGAGALPFIEVEGSGGQMNANGLVKMSKVRSMVERVSGCDMQ